MTGQIIPLDEISRRARRAVEAGMPITLCPYPDDTAAARQWQVAYHGRELELLELSEIKQ